ncbi:hypothetical protein GCM10020295_15610 [Streptomyces cinereospinus]
MARFRTGFRTWVGIAVAGTLCASLAGCSSTGGKRAEDAREAAAAQGKAAVNTPPLDLCDDHPLG